MLEQLQTNEYLCAELVLHTLLKTHTQTIYLECIRFETSSKKRYSVIDYDFGAQKDKTINNLDQNTSKEDFAQ